MKFQLLVCGLLYLTWVFPTSCPRDNETIFTTEPPVNTIDYSKYSYCNITCETRSRAYLHTVCRGCQPEDDDREEIVADFIEFRELILDAHNDFRDCVASGKAAKRNKLIENATNMMILNYDMELEFIIRCYLVSRFLRNHDRCRNTLRNEPVSQNLAHYPANNATLNEYKEMIETWFNQIELVDKPLNPLKSFTNSKGEAINDFTLVVWAEVSRVGCGRIFNPDGPGDWKFVIGCNYASYDGSRQNIKNEDVYEVGEPCSNCPKEHPCNIIYTSLCGKIENTTGEPLSSLNRTKSVLGLSPYKIAFLVAFIALVLMC